MKFLPATAAILLLAVAATAQTTNGLSDAEIQGRNLALQLYLARPGTNLNQTGVLNIRNRQGVSTNLQFKGNTTIYTDHWNNGFMASLVSGGTEDLTIVHTNNSNIYYLYKCYGGGWDGSCDQGAFLFVTENTRFADSDFWVYDLGLEFFHWPEQKVLKKENRRSRACNVLESTNPNPSTNGYSRVVSWIDEESGGIVFAEAYDANRKKLKEFEPKSFKKVNGQWELKDMEIRNVQTRSRTRIEFDLKKK